MAAKKKASTRPATKKTATTGAAKKASAPKAKTATSKKTTKAATSKKTTKTATSKKTTKTATSKKTTKTSKKVTVDPALSLAAVQATIAELRAKGDMLRGLCGPAEKATPLAPEVLASLTLPGGGALPPSVLAWLAYDAGQLDVLDEEGRLDTTTLREFVTAEMEDVAEELGDDEDFDPAEIVEGLLRSERFADAPALRLPDSASQAHFLVFDGTTEPAVLGYEKEFFWVKFKSFGEFVATWFGGRPARGS